MKKIFLLFSLLFFFAGCYSIDSSKGLLASPGEKLSVSVSDIKSDGFQLYLNKIDQFSALLSENLLVDDDYQNQAISPLSIYFAVAMAVECAEGKTLNALLSLLDMTYEEVLSNTAKLYSILSNEYKDNENVIGQCSLSNSIWFDQASAYDASVVETLAKKYYCYAHQLDFYNHNNQANQILQDFIKEKTNGLINQRFDLSKDTLFAMVNTLYFKDQWLCLGEFNYTSQEYKLKNKDGSTVNKKILQSSLYAGMPAQMDTYRHFSISTLHGYQIRFIVPNEEVLLEDIVRKEVWNEVANYEYIIHDGNDQFHETTCYFPAFEATYNKNILDEILLLANTDTLYFNKLMKQDHQCSKIQHVTKLKVDEKGMEGAAATILVGETTAAPATSIIHHDFIINRDFAYIILDPNGIPIFTGKIVNFSK